MPEDTGPARMFQVTKSGDPRLRAIAERVAGIVRIAAEKAVAHDIDPQGHPMSAEPGSLEFLFLNRLRALPTAGRQRVVDRVRPRLMATAAERQALHGELARIDLRLARTIAQQADDVPSATPVQLSARELMDVVERSGAEITDESGQLQAEEE